MPTPLRHSNLMGQASRRVSVWEELDRRRVLRVVVAYLAASWPLIRAAQLALSYLGAPEWAFRAVLGIATLGFPVTVVLAWTYDVTPEGIKKTPEDATTDPTYDAGPAQRWAVFVVISLLTGLVLWAL